MDPFDKTQTDPIWQRVWNRQPLAPPPQPASPGPGRPVPPPPPEQRGRMTPQPEPRREPVERTLLRLLTQARQFENMYAASQNHPQHGPVFSQFRQEMVQAIRILLLLLGSQNR